MGQETELDGKVDNANRHDSLSLALYCGGASLQGKLAGLEKNPTSRCGSIK